jgi:hypothetical protein
MKWKEYHEELEKAGHKLILDKDGNVDTWFVDWDKHNGPGCQLCGQGWCHHCQKEIKPCPCGETQQEKSKLITGLES